MSGQLSRGAIGAILKGAEIAKPVFQVLKIKQIKQQNNSLRYKMDLYDGADTVDSMLAQQYNELATNGTLADGCVIELSRYVCSEVQGRQIVICLECKVLTKGHPGFSAEANPAHPVNSVTMPMNAPPQPQQPQIMRPMHSAPPRQYGSIPPQQVQPQYQQPAQLAQQPQQRFNAGGNATAPMQVSPNPNPYVQRGGAVAFQQNMADASGNTHITPIRTINPYNSRWVIKARVTSKGDVKRWDKGPTNQGQLFSVVLVDKDGGEIRGTFFREAVDKFHPMLQEGQVYTFSGARVKVANQEFSQVKHEYELTFDQSAQIEHCAQDSSIAQVTMKRTPIAQIANMAPNALIDILGVATEIGELSSFTSKAGKELTKLVITLVDESASSIQATMWGDRAKDFKIKTAELGANPVVCLKTAKVSDWGGRTLNTNQVVLEPNVPEVAALRSWFQSGGASGVQSLSTQGKGIGSGPFAPKPVIERHTLQSIKDLGLGKNDKGDVVEIKATVTHLFADKNIWYYASPDSNHKVTQNPDGSWFSEAVGKNFTHKVNRYIMRASIADYTGQVVISLFDETARIIMNEISADDLEIMKDQSPDEYMRVVKGALNKTYYFKLRLKEEVYNEQARVKATVMSVAKLDLVEECKELIKAIELY